MKAQKNVSNMKRVQLKLYPAVVIIFLVISSCFATDAEVSVLQKSNLYVKVLKFKNINVYLEDVKLVGIRHTFRHSYKNTHVLIQNSIFKGRKTFKNLDGFRRMKLND